MKRQIFKRILACASATVCSFGALTGLSASALTAQPAPVQVLALGDDCLAEVSGMTSAVDYVADYLGGTSSNYAKIGQKSSELVQALQTDSTIQNAVAQADVILVSIGMNDLIAPILYEDNDLIDASQYSTLVALANGIPSDLTLLSSYNTKLEQTLPEIVTEAATEITKTVQLIRQENPDANIIVQTVTNPLAVETKAMADDVSQNRRAALSTMYSYLKVCLQGGTSGNMTIPTGLNETIAALPDVAVSDFYLPYIGATGEKSLGFYLSDIANLNMTFTEIGQIVEASYAIAADAQLADGDGSVLANAYAASGEAETLASTRAALDTTIQSISDNTKTTFYLGDVNQDGEITTDDAYLVLVSYANASVGNKSDLIPALRKAADADNDNKISPDDAYLWLQYYALRSVGDDTPLDTFLQENGRKA